MYPVDQTDLRILQKLQEPTSKLVTRAELAKRIDSPTHSGHHIAESTLGEHIKALEDVGIIKHYSVELDGEKLGLDFLAYVGVYLDKYTPADLEIFRTKVRGYPNVLSCDAVTGSEIDFLLKVATTTRKKFYEVMQVIHALPGVSHFVTMVIVDVVKEDTGLPLDHLHNAPLIHHHRNSSA